MFQFSYLSSTSSWTFSSSGANTKHIDTDLGSSDDDNDNDDVSKRKLFIILVKFYLFVNKNYSQIPTASYKR